MTRTKYINKFSEETFPENIYHNKFTTLKILFFKIKITQRIECTSITPNQAHIILTYYLHIFTNMHFVDIGFIIQKDLHNRRNHL